MRITMPTPDSELLEDVLYIQKSGARLCAINNALVVFVDERPALRLPAHHVRDVVLFGRISVSPSVYTMAAKNGFSIAFLSHRGGWNGRFLPEGALPCGASGLRRGRQWRIAAGDSSRRVALARPFVRGKILNCAGLARCFARKRGGSEGDWMREAALRLDDLASAIGEAGTLDGLRGIEGSAARHWFSVLGDCICPARRGDFPFHGRNRRPPRDRVNAALSFVYTLLLADCSSALAAAGLDPLAGFLHETDGARPSLALDLCEELRPLLGDRFVVSLINQGRLRPGHFRSGDETESVYLNEAGRRAVLEAWQARGRERTKCPASGQDVAWRRVAFLQARRLSDSLARETLPAYQPFCPRI